jgi:hypothetical protein
MKKGIKEGRKDKGEKKTGKRKGKRTVVVIVGKKGRKETRSERRKI